MLISIWNPSQFIKVSHVGKDIITQSERGNIGVLNRKEDGTKKECRKLAAFLMFAEGSKIFAVILSDR